MALIEVGTQVFTAGGNVALPAGIQLDGGNVVYPNMDDPQNPTDGANRQFVESLIPSTANVVYVKDQSDFGPLVSIRGFPYHNVTQSTIFVVTENVTISDGGIGTNVAGVAISIVTLGKNNSAITRLSFNPPTPQPIFAIENMSTNSFMLQNVEIYRLGGGNQIELFDFQTTSTSGLNTIWAENCNFNGFQTLGNISYLAFNFVGQFTFINNSISQTFGTLTLSNVPYVTILNNYILNPAPQPVIDVFTHQISSALNFTLIAKNNYVESNNIETSLFNLQNTSATLDNDYYLITDNTLRGGRLFNPAGLTQTSYVVKALNNFGNEDSASNAWAYQVTGGPYLQNMDAVNVPQIVDTDPTNSTVDNWVLDTNIRGFIVTREAIPDIQINNGSPGTNQSIVFEYILLDPGLYRMTVYTALNPPNSTNGIGFFINTGNGWDAIAASFRLVDNGQSLWRTSDIVQRLFTGNKITFGIETDGSLGSSYPLNNPSIILQKIRG